MVFGRKTTEVGSAQAVSRQSGYVLTDALVAMLILSLSLMMSLSALGRAREVADVASEVRRAQVLMVHLMETAPRRYGSVAGLSDEFAWSVETVVTGAERPIEICRRALTLKNARSGRTYAAATQEVCPITAGAEATPATP